MAVPEQLGDFRIVEEIGRGGFGIVYRAQQVSLDRPVALKVLYRHLIHTQDQISRFEREARAAARLDHDAIVSVYAWGEDGDDFYIAQRLIGSGRTLADELARLKQEGSPPKGYFRDIARKLARVAEGLQQAHDRGIVHRDVKPSNVLLDGGGEPFLGDFGLAKVEDGLELSRTGDFAGSPYYMSPEQADSKRGTVDHRSDIYALGVTLYEMLALAPPFHGTTAHEVIRKILGEEPKRPSKLHPRVPADLETICLHAMEKNPLRRYPSALEFSRDLHAFLDGEPISAVPIGTTRRLVRKMRRHGQTVGLAAMGAVLIGGAIWVTQFVRSTGDDLEVRDVGLTAQQAAEADRSKESQKIEEVFSERLDQALAAGDVQEAQRLANERQSKLATIDDQYQKASAFISEQIAEADVDAIGTAAGKILTGGLQGFMNFLAGEGDEGGDPTLDGAGPGEGTGDVASLTTDPPAPQPGAGTGAGVAPPGLPGPPGGAGATITPPTGEPQANADVGATAPVPPAGDAGSDDAVADGASPDPGTEADDETTAAGDSGPADGEVTNGDDDVESEPGEDG